MKNSKIYPAPFGNKKLSKFCLFSERCGIYLLLILIILGGLILSFFYVEAITIEKPVKVTISAEVPSPPSPPTGGGGGAAPPPAVTKVVLQGKAYPLSSITVLQDGKIITTTIADAQANFKIEITNITAGIWTFGIWAEDKEGRKSITFSFTTSVTSGMTTTISGIFLPPTIDIDKTLVQRGETLNILGITAPQSEVSIFVRSPQEIIKKTNAKTDGTWFHPFDTTPLEDGFHTTRAKAASPEGLLSTFSQTLAFSVGKEVVGIKKADINEDKKVNLVDFSILLYNWGIPKNPTADLNGDGRVNLTDFSILLYWWTG